MRNNVNSIWTEDRIEMLRKLWASGISFSNIAAEIGVGVTRSAISGKIGRLGLTGRDTANRIYGKRSLEQIEATKRRKAERRNERRRIQRVSFVMVNLEALRCTEVVPMHKSLLELGPNDCRYPYGSNAPYTFCGHPQMEGHSYCGPHFALSARRGSSS